MDNSELKKAWNLLWFECPIKNAQQQVTHYIIISISGEGNSLSPTQYPSQRVW